MPPRTVLHFKNFTSVGARCGAFVPESEMTLDPKRVTCTACLRQLGREPSGVPDRNRDPDDDDADR